ncbi:hypothetical protein Ct9H90mP29_01530 [bacterium]|nr:MAG: hypothetical protein Ct9H90mP29_01530 [bacterium]
MNKKKKRYPIRGPKKGTNNSNSPGLFSISFCSASILQINTILQNKKIIAINEELKQKKTPQQGGVFDTTFSIY